MMSCQEVERLMEIMYKLRSEEGCPWDREQDHHSLKPYLLEETYEVLEAIDEDDMEHLKEELGDLLLQIVFHSVIAEERGEFSFSEVVRGIADKLVRRHPHVFDSFEVKDAREVKIKWEKIKASERKGEEKKEGSILNRVPATLPALSLAQKVQERAADVGFDWPDLKGAWDKLREELGEFAVALKTEDTSFLEEELGDIFFALVNLARFLQIDSELSLRKAVKKFKQRFRYIEDALAAEGRRPEDSTLEEMDALWNEAKILED